MVSSRSSVPWTVDRTRVESSSRRPLSMSGRQRIRLAPWPSARTLGRRTPPSHPPEPRESRRPFHENPRIGNRETRDPPSRGSQNRRRRSPSQHSAPRPRPGESVAMELDPQSNRPLEVIDPVGRFCEKPKVVDTRAVPPCRLSTGRATTRTAATTTVAIAMSPGPDSRPRVTPFAEAIHG